MCRPVLFLKPPSAAVYAAEQSAKVPVELVKGKGDVHYEAEVVLRLNEALEVDAVTLGLDLTLRDLQAKLKKDGHPWEIAKVSSFSCSRRHGGLLQFFPGRPHEESLQVSYRSPYEAPWDALSAPCCFEGT